MSPNPRWRDVLDDADLIAAIRHGADAGGARIAGRLDPRRAIMWAGIAEDQHQLAGFRLELMLAAHGERHRPGATLR